MKRPVYLIRSWEILYYKYIQVLHCNSVYSPKLKKKERPTGVSFLLVMYLCISFFSEIKKTAEISLKYLYGDQPRYRKAVCDVASFRKRNSIADHLLPIWNRLFLTKQTEHIIIEEQNILIDRCLLACNFLVSEHSSRNLWWLAFWSRISKCQRRHMNWQCIQCCVFRQLFSYF